MLKVSAKRIAGEAGTLVKQFDLETPNQNSPELRTFPGVEMWMAGKSRRQLNHLRSWVIRDCREKAIAGPVQLDEQIGVHWARVVCRAKNFQQKQVT